MTRKLIVTPGDAPVVAPKKPAVAPVVPKKKPGA
jgi:hypothetical protein